jgi:hypothetical protein
MPYVALFVEFERHLPQTTATRAINPLCWSATTMSTELPSAR